MYKKNLVTGLILLIAATSTVSAQDQSEPAARPDVPGILFFEVGFNLLLNNDVEGFETSLWGSKTFNVYYLHDIRIGNSKFFFLPGFGVGLDKYKFEDNNVTLNVPSTNPDTTRLVSPVDVIGPGIEIKKSKLAANYFDIPLELRFYTNPDDVSRSFRVGIGGKIGVLYSAHTKINYEFDDHLNKLKHKRDFNLSRIRYGVNARVGIGAFNLYAYYALSELFEDGKGPGDTEMNTLNVGLSINAF